MIILLYLVCIVVANLLSLRYGVTIGQDVIIPAGTIAIAPIFTLRDSVQHRYGSRVAVYLVVCAAVVSSTIALSIGQPRLGRIAVAGVIAFVVSELLDTTIYILLSDHEWLARVLASNTIACAVDSAIFLSIAFQLTWGAFAGQYLVKILISTLVGVLLLRAQRRRAARR